MNDKVTGYLRMARDELMQERDEGLNSRELSVTLTQIDTAILWRREDLRIKEPIIDDKSES